mmetsp:Transcript_6407/g.9329  ORF Transcript_6407/g.9329 Transcript_6407/m.9329 type:complete len:280 (+) Transcript_6407:52-891(+)
MSFGQFIVGPPGSGKTTYTNGMFEFCKSLGRKPVIVNLDPANYYPPYTPDIDIQDLISLETTMEKLHLGPNGGLMYSLQYLEKKIGWLGNLLKPYCESGDHYFLFDCPGQVELFTVYDTMLNISKYLTDELQIRLTCVNLMDAHYCTDETKYISLMLVSLSMSLRLALPQVNCLSKVDMLKSIGAALPFSLEQFENFHDIKELLYNRDSNNRYIKLNHALVHMLDNFNHVSFLPLAIEDKEKVARVLKLVDKCNGYIFIPPENIHEDEEEDEGETLNEV